MMCIWTTIRYRVLAIATAAIFIFVPASSTPVAAVEERQPLESTSVVATHDNTVSSVSFTESETAGISSRSATRTLQADATPPGERRLSSVAITWSEAGSSDLKLRYRDDRAWSDWIPLEAEYSDDVQSASAVQSTGPVYVGTADAVQARMMVLGNDVASSTATPQLIIIDWGYTLKPQQDSENIPGQDETIPSIKPTITPTIHTREEWWRSDLPERTWTPDRDANWRGAIVHHTVDRNDYSRAEVKAIIQNIYTFHCEERGWGDIGYNLLVDRFGGIWEGRDEGVANAMVQASNVEAAHTGSFNTATFGVAVIGSFHLDDEPSDAAIESTASAIAWEFAGLGLMDATGTFEYHGTQQRISGHGDGSHWYNAENHTLCPGIHLSDRLPDIRTITDSLLHGIMPEGGTPVYRLYNPNDGLHHYTADSAERESLVALGWNDEHVIFYANNNSGAPVYRLYNPNDSNHFWTMNPREYDYLVSIGWNGEHQAWYAADESSQPIYRLYNPHSGEHFYTDDANERTHLSDIGWQDENIAWYGLT